MEPLWKVSSGNFAGWRSDELLYDAEGDNVGYFDGNVAFSLDGDYIGEIYEEDWIGKRLGTMQAGRGLMVEAVGVALAPLVDRVGLAVAGWDDPEF